VGCGIRRTCLTSEAERVLLKRRWTGGDGGSTWEEGEAAGETAGCGGRLNVCHRMPKCRGGVRGVPAARVTKLLDCGPGDTLNPSEEGGCAAAPRGGGEKGKGEGVVLPAAARGRGRDNGGAESGRLGAVDQLPDGWLSAGRCVQLVRRWRFLDTAPAVFAAAFATTLAGVRPTRRVARSVGHRRAASLRAIACGRATGRSGKRHGGDHQESHGAKPRLSGGSAHEVRCIRLFTVRSVSMTRNPLSLGVTYLSGLYDPCAL